MKPQPFLPELLNGQPNYVRDQSGGQVWHRCETRVLYADTDRSQVVYHGNYLRYFEFGRASLMRDAGYPYKEVEENGYVYPIIELGLKYFSPLQYDDPIWVNTRPADLERVRLSFDYVITHQETGALICSGTTRHCATKTNGVPVGIDDQTLHLWKTFPR
ncbi:MAG: acyl-CoA thioesterase [Desulfobacteraceae bacterium]|nr:acyl-CoA thioesterase [Desulfobacteraceae bacterium]MBC2753892.1 acyl-CoA thioesterase [Desulfobacteraceae bacterium]